MSGETNLAVLLKNLMPVKKPGEYVFVSVAPSRVTAELMMSALATFKEKEGISLILEVGAAKEFELTYEGTYSCITCEVHSSLDAVGMTAAMTAALTHTHISANVVAGFYHDHIFVPTTKADQAVMVLSSLSLE
ncbi:ACT domain-containing protein [Alteromonas sp. 345S023]|uniref:ACT domain-containing protein n=1 Tax=Alteromonas profundi TaxID=2696062 RepID=A0A7X5LNX9_9ALTE|nr:ACT domain-containing protein [Alteromonas profundi]NDV92434.1 ACT domain-containing protein [Alteromonas profundi]